jgi:hypothetical protein
MCPRGNSRLRSWTKSNGTAPARLHLTHGSRGLDLSHLTGPSRRAAGGHLSQPLTRQQRGHDEYAARIPVTRCDLPSNGRRTCWPAQCPGPPASPPARPDRGAGRPEAFPNWPRLSQIRMLCAHRPPPKTRYSADRNRQGHGNLTFSSRSATMADSGQRAISASPVGSCLRKPSSRFGHSACRELVGQGQ